MSACHSLCAFVLSVLLTMFVLVLTDTAKKRIAKGVCGLEHQSKLKAIFLRAVNKSVSGWH